MLSFRGAGALVLTAAVGTGVLFAAPATASVTSATKVGAWSKSWTWFDKAVGPVDIYRGYDPGFAFATWQDTNSYKAHPLAPQNDYTFNLPPAEVASGAEDAKLITFLKTTPWNIVLTNYHEPEQEIDAGLFSASAFRASEAHLAWLVHQQNLADAGKRKVSLVLMISTFTHFKSRDPNTYWPTSADCPALTVAAQCEPLDLVSVDAYAPPHATGTTVNGTVIPVGYTDGLKWPTAATLLAPAYNWSKTARPWLSTGVAGTPWAISELGYLEDVNIAARKADALTAAVTYAKQNNAQFIEYWDSKGGRADWELHFTAPASTVSTSSTTASDAWKAAVDAAS